MGKFHFITPQYALDGVPLCFMLRRFSRPNRARGEGPVRIGRLRRMNARFFSGWKIAANK
jgi:hypothetical protein